MKFYWDFIKASVVGEKCEESWCFDPSLQIAGVTLSVGVELSGTDFAVLQLCISFDTKIAFARNGGDGE